MAARMTMCTEEELEGKTHLPAGESCGYGFDVDLRTEVSCENHYLEVRRLAK